jgi:predicted HTH transcriptional regulator
MAQRRYIEHQAEQRDAAVAKALSARRESKAVEFRSEFDPASRGAWCEILKDILAMANSGGGVIVFGIEGAGRPSGADMRGILGLDPAELIDKIHAYTGVHFATSRSSMPPRTAISLRRSS